MYPAAQIWNEGENARVCPGQGTTHQKESFCRPGRYRGGGGILL